jgi:hypothetical protein
MSLVSPNVELKCDGVALNLRALTMAPNDKRASESFQPLPKKTRKPLGLPPISWTADLTWRLLAF